MRKPFFDILLVIPLEEELLEVQNVFPEKEDLSSETARRYEAQVGDSDLRMIVVQQEEMGRKSARDAVEAAFDDFDFGFVLCLGIAGSLSEDLRLCDVCYSEHVADFYDNTKAQETKDGELEIRFSPNHSKCYAPVVAAMNFIRTIPALQDLHADWQLEREELASRMFPTEVVGRDGKLERISQPKSKQCKVACAAVSKSEKYNNKIRDTDRKLLAIETEIGGVLAAVSRRKVHALTIRGISDYADHAKDQLEGTTGGRIRSLAAGNAATFLRLQFRNPKFVSAITKLRSLDASEVQTELPVLPRQRDVTTLIAECAQKIDEKLRELAPEFKLLEKGYCLPVPRMRNVQYVSGMGTKYTSDPEEVRDALERHNGILLGLAKNYPDASESGGAKVGHGNGALISP
ncbi:phosphorylase family protein [Mesorhizobium sp. A556]